MPKIQPIKMSNSISVLPFYGGDSEKSTTYWSYYPDRNCNDTEIRIGCPNACAKKNGVICSPLKGTFIIIPVDQIDSSGKILKVLDMNIGGPPHLWEPGPENAILRENQIFNLSGVRQLTLTSANLPIMRGLDGSLVVGLNIGAIQMVKAPVPNNWYYFASSGLYAQPLGPPVTETRYFNFETFGWEKHVLRACNVYLLDPFSYAQYKSSPNHSLFYKVDFPSFKRYATAIPNANNICPDGSHYVDKRGGDPYGCSLQLSSIDEYFTEKYQQLFGRPVSDFMNSEQKAAYCGIITDAGGDPFDPKNAPFCGDPLNAASGAVDVRMKYCAANEDRLFGATCANFIARNANKGAVHPIIQSKMEANCSGSNLSAQMSDACYCFWGPKQIEQRQYAACKGLGLSAESDISACQNALFNNQPVNCWSHNCRRALIHKDYSQCGDTVACINVANIDVKGNATIKIENDTSCDGIRKIVDAYRATHSPTGAGPSGGGSKSSVGLSITSIGAIIVLIVLLALTTYYVVKKYF